MNKILSIFIVMVLMVSCGSSKKSVRYKRRKRKTSYRLKYPPRKSSHKKNKNTSRGANKSKPKPVYKSKPKPTKVSKNKTTTNGNKNPSVADKIIWTAFKYKGTRYRYGGTTKKGMDCSGLVMVSFAERGISLPRSSHGMSQKGRYVPLKQAKRGDLIFFKTNPRNPKRITHVGLVTHIKENGVVQFLHASTKRGVVLNRMDERYYKRNFAGVRRVLD